jgi:peptidoglycan/LPS O-acetylase OafA/YrhL
VPGTPTDDCLGYEPAIDGIRAAAVIAVLLFHGEVSWAEGGFLGVSTFFTLSGFLITTLLLREHTQRKTIDLVHFWGRRFRRLMPAALVCLLGVVVFGATVATASQLVDLRGGILSSLAYVANWWLIAVGSSYADLFTAPSPIQHFWSLAIEEQFYVLFPLLVAGVLVAGKGSRRVLGLVFGGMAVASVVWSATLTGLLNSTPDRVYYGTDTRAAELLVGALLAVAVARRGSPVFEGRGGQIVRGAGLAGAVLLGVLWTTTAIDERWIYWGGLGAYALISALVVLAAVQPAGPIRTALAWKPLVAIGLISYGLYLYHWPIYLWLTEDRTGLDGLPLLTLRLTATGIAAAASFVLIERPIRSRKMLTGLAPWVAAPVMATVIAVAAIAVTADAPTDEVVDLAGAEQLSEEVDPVDPAEVAAGDPDSVPKEPGAPRIAVYGDSSALTLARGLNQWIQGVPNALRAGGVTPLGCGIGRGGERIYEDGPAPTPDDCWSDQWARSVVEGQPDIAVVLVGPWDVTDRRLPGDDTWRAPGDPVYDEYLLSEMEAGVDILTSGGAEVVWLTSPQMVVGQVDGVPPDDVHPASELGRVDRINELIYQLAAERPDDVHVVDLRGYLASLPGGELDPELRPDAVHFTTPAAEEISTDWLGAQLLSVYQQAHAGAG